MGYNANDLPKFHAFAHEETQLHSEQDSCGAVYLPTRLYYQGITPMFSLMYIKHVRMTLFSLFYAQEKSTTGYSEQKVVRFPKNGTFIIVPLL